MHHMHIDGIAQVGRHPFPEPAHHVKASGRKQRQRHRHRKQGDEVLTQRQYLSAFVCGIQAAIDQAAQGQRKHQCGHGGHDKKEAGQHNPAAVRAQKRPQT